MATTVEFTKNEESGRYEYGYTSTGDQLVMQVDFGETPKNPSECYVDVLARTSADMPYVRVENVDMWGGNSKMFKLDIPMGIQVLLQAFLPVEHAEYVVVE